MVTKQGEFVNPTIFGLNLAKIHMVTKHIYTSLF